MLGDERHRHGSRNARAQLRCLQLQLSIAAELSVEISFLPARAVEQPDMGIDFGMILEEDGKIVERANFGRDRFVVSQVKHRGRITLRDGFANLHFARHSIKTRRESKGRSAQTEPAVGFYKSYAMSLPAC
ncbi:hypothetical protein [Bradyrhizobium guangzhouense]|uniref:hypothetical protein n=1 Tax=Bradyrhizobium guangzhouense TaxID=1325095 RepID=UPI001FE02C8D|nr:hypothetical protein [Bradyrhizobium guangzhouense]